jgi:hypothetical protein
LIVVDSSGWIEFFADGPHGQEFAARLRQPGNVLTPTVAIYEVYKWIKRERSEDEAMQAVATMNRTNVVDLTEDRHSCMSALGRTKPCSPARHVSMPHATVSSSGQRLQRCHPERRVEGPGRAGALNTCLAPPPTQVPRLDARDDTLLRVPKFAEHALKAATEYRTAFRPGSGRQITERVLSPASRASIGFRLAMPGLKTEPTFLRRLQRRAARRA